MKFSALTLAGVLVCAGSALAAPICPVTTANASGADSTGCGVLITYTDAGGKVTIPGTGPYDGSDDTTVGIINNSSKALTTISLTANNGAFGFDGDGIQTFASTNGVTIPTGGATGYEGPNMTYDTSKATGGNGTLIINFTTPVAAGANTWLSLEGDPSVGGGIIPNPPGPPSAAPEPASFAMLGGGILMLGSLALRRRRK